MKKFLSSLVLAACCLLAAAQNDEAAIKDVLLRETKAFYNRDVNGFLHCWHVVPQTMLYVVVDPHKVITMSGNEMVKEKLENKWKSGPVDISIDRGDWSFYIKGKNAYVTFDQTTTETKAKKKSFSHEARFMEQVNGEWKIVSSFVALINKE